MLSGNNNVTSINNFFRSDDFSFEHEVLFTNSCFQITNILNEMFPSFYFLNLRSDTQEAHVSH